MENIIKVGMADLNVATNPEVLTTLGLGSCVGVCLYDSINKIAGMAHIMLPYSVQSKADYRYRHSLAYRSNGEKRSFQVATNCEVGRRSSNVQF